MLAKNIFDASQKNMCTTGQAILYFIELALPALSNIYCTDSEDIFETFRIPFLPADGLVDRAKRLEVVPRPSIDQPRVPRSSLVLVLLLEDHLCRAKRDRKDTCVNTLLITIARLSKISTAGGSWQRCQLLEGKPSNE